MSFVITEPCVDCKYTDCVVVCPCDCIYRDETQLYIAPDDCIDCEACVSECPVEAIYSDNDVPPQWSHYVELNTVRARTLKASGGKVTERQQR